jgi:four helix bundle protein
MNKIELENRLIKFSVSVIEGTDRLDKKAANLHLKDQLIRSSTACALNYGEAQSAESRKDFIHKSGIVMKELRETQVNLKMLNLLNPGFTEGSFADLIKENDELLAIMYRTIQTAKKKS